MIIYLLFVYLCGSIIDSTARVLNPWAQVRPDNSVRAKKVILTDGGSWTFTICSVTYLRESAEGVFLGGYYCPDGEEPAYPISHSFLYVTPEKCEGSMVERGNVHYIIRADENDPTYSRFLLDLSYDDLSIDSDDNIIYLTSEEMVRTRLVSSAAEDLEEARNEEQFFSLGRASEFKKNIYVHYDIGPQMWQSASYGKAGAMEYMMQLNIIQNIETWHLAGFNLIPSSFSFRSEPLAYTAKEIRDELASSEKPFKSKDSHIYQHITTRPIGGGMSFFSGLYPADSYLLADCLTNEIDGICPYSVTGSVGREPAKRFSHYDQSTPAHMLGHLFGLLNTHQQDYASRDDYDECGKSDMTQSQRCSSRPNDGGTLMSYCHLCSGSSGSYPRQYLHSGNNDYADQMFNINYPELSNLDHPELYTGAIPTSGTMCAYEALEGYETQNCDCGSDSTIFFGAYLNADQTVGVWTTKAGIDGSPTPCDSRSDTSSFPDVIHNEIKVCYCVPNVDSPIVSNIQVGESITIDLSDPYQLTILPYASASGMYGDVCGSKIYNDNTYGDCDSMPTATRRRLCGGESGCINSGITSVEECARIVTEEITAGRCSPIFDVLSDLARAREFGFERCSCLLPGREYKTITNELFTTYKIQILPVSGLEDVPDDYTKAEKSCVLGSDITSATFNSQTLSSCAFSCDINPLCVAFNFGVDHGGDTDGDAASPGLCQLVSSPNPEGCDGEYLNFDLYTRTSLIPSYPVTTQSLVIDSDGNIITTSTTTTTRDPTATTMSNSNTEDDEADQETGESMIMVVVGACAVLFVVFAICYCYCSRFCTSVEEKDDMIEFNSADSQKRGPNPSINVIPPTALEPIASDQSKGGAEIMSPSATDKPAVEMQTTAKKDDDAVEMQTTAKKDDDAVAVTVQESTAEETNQDPTKISLTTELAWSHEDESNSQTKSPTNSEATAM